MSAWDLMWTVPPSMVFKTILTSTSQVPLISWFCFYFCFWLFQFKKPKNRKNQKNEKTEKQRKNQKTEKTKKPKTRKNQKPEKNQKTEKTKKQRKNKERKKKKIVYPKLKLYSLIIKDTLNKIQSHITNTILGTNNGIIRPLP